MGQSEVKDLQQENKNFPSAMACLVRESKDLETHRKIPLLSFKLYKLYNSEEILTQLCHNFALTTKVISLSNFFFVLCDGKLPSGYVPSKLYWKHVVRGEKYELLKRVPELGYVRYAQSKKMIDFFTRLFPDTYGTTHKRSISVKMDCLVNGQFDANLYKYAMERLRMENFYVTKGETYAFRMRARKIARNTKNYDVLGYTPLPLVDPNYLLYAEFHKEELALFSPIQERCFKGCWIKEIFAHPYPRVLIQCEKEGMLVFKASPGKKEEHLNKGRPLFVHYSRADEILEMACKQAHLRGREDDIEYVKYLVETKNYKVGCEAVKAALRSFNLNIFCYLLDHYNDNLTQNMFDLAKAKKEAKLQYVLRALQKCENYNQRKRSFLGIPNKNWKEANDTCYSYFIATYGLNSYDDIPC